MIYNNNLHPSWCIAVPSSSPTGIAYSSVTSTTAAVAWSALSLEDKNGMVRYYLVNVTETNTGLQYQIQSTTQYITLNNLHPYYTYNVQIAAYTIGPGPYSNVAILTTAEDGKNLVITTSVLLFV